MKQIVSSFTLVALACASLNVSAQSDSMSSPSEQVIVRSGGTGYTPSGPAPVFAELDTSGNGSIDSTEAILYKLLANDFLMADSNRDGNVSKREYERWASMP